ncbi:hypothetical protein [Actinospongicola halichondriae]|uniref:hypothetical protein n=1 Tax=Actinospongicola halichondriae TaxID=3236844 RepID=UPI003D4951B1
MAKTSPATPAPANPADAEPDANKDWPAQATDAIVTQVGNIRDKTTGPVLKAARYAIFAAFAISLGTVALIILVIGLVRLLDNYLPNSVFGETHTWAAHSILGAVLFVIGFVLFMLKARAKPKA